MVQLVELEIVELELKEGVGILTVNRPGTLNALNTQALQEINRLIDLAAVDRTIQVLVVTGVGSAFVAGSDITEQSVFNQEGGRKWGRSGSAVFRKLELLPIPTIAAVNGLALGGGCELALACDMIVASEKAEFGQPEVSLGIIPGFSGTQRLPRRIGKTMAMELILTGRRIKADEALRIGLVNKVIEPEALIAEAFCMAKDIIRNGPLAVKYAKEAIIRGLEIDLDSGIALENELFAMCFTTEDQKEGMQAFLEKREAEFKGR